MSKHRTVTGDQLLAEMAERRKAFLARVHLEQQKITVASTLEQIEYVLCLAGRNGAPWLLHDLMMERRMTAETLRAVICDVWSACEFPCRAIDRDLWVIWFGAAGFVTEGDHAKPTEPVEVWRAQVGRKVGLSWTWSRERALWFHERNVKWGLDSRVLHGFAPPESVLAVIHSDEGRKEEELVIKPSPRFWANENREAKSKAQKQEVTP